MRELIGDPGDLLDVRKDEVLLAREHEKRKATAEATREIRLAETATFEKEKHCAETERIKADTEGLLIKNMSQFLIQRMHLLKEGVPQEKINILFPLPSL